MGWYWNNIVRVQPGWISECNGLLEALQSRYASQGNEWEPLVILNIDEKDVSVVPSNMLSDDGEINNT